MTEDLSEDREHHAQEHITENITLACDMLNICHVMENTMPVCESSVTVTKRLLFHTHL